MTDEGNPSVNYEKTCELRGIEIGKLRARLSTLEAENGLLREAIKAQDCLCGEGRAIGQPGESKCWRCEALSTPQHKALDEVRAKVWEEAAKMLCLYCQQGHTPILWKHPEFDDADDLETYYHETGANYRMCAKLARACHAKAAALRRSA